MAEYAAVYGGPPAPTDPWPLFLALARRTAQFWKRRQLLQLDAVSVAVSAVLADDGGASERHRAELEKGAYPTSQPAHVEFLPNAFSD